MQSRNLDNLKIALCTLRIQKLDAKLKTAYPILRLCNTFECAILELCNQERNPKITQAQSCSNWQPVIFSSCDGIPRLLASCSLGNIIQFGKVNNVIHFPFLHTKYIVVFIYASYRRLIKHNPKVARLFYTISRLHTYLCQVVLRTRLARNFQILQHNLKIAQILKPCKFLNCTVLYFQKMGSTHCSPQHLLEGLHYTYMSLEYTDIHVCVCCHNNHLPNHMHVLTFVSASVIQY